jgi:thiol-disulfide isomerase/thioredoxin
MSNRLNKSFLSQAAAPAATLSGGGFFDKFKLPTSAPLRIVIFILFAVIIGVVLYYAYNYLTKKFKVGYKENSEHIPVDGMSSNEAEILLFSTTWCPHCKSAKPIWEEVKNEYKGKTVNGYTIIFTEVDCTNESPEVTKMMDRYKIEGFPTIKLIKNGQVIEFDAKVSKENLEKFINTAV